MTVPDPRPLGTFDDDREAALAAAEVAGRVDDAFRTRIDDRLPQLHEIFTELYAGRPGGRGAFTRTVALASSSWNVRPLDLKVRDGQRLAEPEWFSSERMLAGQCYADRYGGNLAGIGDQIPYFRELGLTCLQLMPVFDAAAEPGTHEVDRSLGSLARLTELAAELRVSGIALALDLPPGRSSSDAAPTASEDPAALREVAGEMLFLANLGVDVLRVEADPLGAQAPLLLRALSVVLALAAPGAVIVSSTDGAALREDPLQAVLTWEALATRDGRLLQRALDRRSASPGSPGTAAVVTGVRSHDALDWSFPDADAVELGIDPAAHRRFLTDFYTGEHEGSFARGVPFAASPDGDPAVAGTTASLAGVEAQDAGGEDRVVLAHALALSTGGLPMLYLGDEVAQLSDHTYADDPERQDDSRWVHRGQRPRDRYADRHDLATPAGRVFRRLTKLISVRQSTPEFAGDALIGFHTPHASVVGYQRVGAAGEVGDGRRVLVLANVGDVEVAIDPLTLSGFARTARDLLHDTDLDLDEGLTLPPLAFAWLRVEPL